MRGVREMWGLTRKAQKDKNSPGVLVSATVLVVVIAVASRLVEGVGVAAVLVAVVGVVRLHTCRCLTLSKT